MQRTVFFMMAVSAFLKAYHLVFDSLEVGDFHVVTVVKQACIDSKRSVSA